MFARQFHIALLAALSLFAVAQALAPASAAAQDDQPGCLRVTTWPYVEWVKDCPKDGSAGPSEQIVIVDTKPGDKRPEPKLKPEPIRLPSGPGFDRSGGGDSGRLGPGTRGGGGEHSGAAPRKPSTLDPHTCQRYARNIRKYLSDDLEISGRRLGFWSWLIRGGAIKTDQYEASVKAFKAGCPGQVPTSG